MNFFDSKKIHVVLFGLFLLFILPLLLRPSWFPSDDAYFYLQIANNIFKGKGSTFHTVTPTNGYHPLWMLFCVASAFVAQGNTSALLYSVVVIQILLFGGIVAYFFKINNLLKITSIFVALPVIATYFLCLGQIGSEGHLYGFFLLVAAWYSLRTLESTENSTAIILGILFGLLFLSRLDSMFVIGSWIACLFIFKKKTLHNGAFRWLILVGIAMTVIALPYLVYNYLQFGHITPISGKIKSTFPAINGKISSLGNIGLLSFLTAIGTLLYFSFKKENSLLQQRVFFTAMSLGVIFHALYIVLFTHHSTTYTWYYVPGVMNMCFVSALAFDWFGRRFLKEKHRVAEFGLVVMLSFFGIFRGWSEFSNPNAESFNPFQVSFKKEQKWQIEIGKWLQANLPPGERILIYDWPGMVAYYSGMNLIPTDGLVNDYRYNVDIRTKGIRRYMKEKNIRYVIGPLDSLRGEFHHYTRYVNYIDDSGQTVYISTPIGAQPAGKFRLENTGLIIRFSDTIHGALMPDLALWKIID